jgi:hypothetical protein
MMLSMRRIIPLLFAFWQWFNQRASCRAAASPEARSSAPPSLTKKARLA